MKKVLLSAFALCVFTVTAFAEGTENDVKKTNLPEKEISDCINDGPDYDCVFFVSVWDKDGLYVRGEGHKKWTNNAEDCCELADLTVKIEAKTLQPGQTVHHDL